MKEYIIIIQYKDEREFELVQSFKSEEALKAFLKSAYDKNYKYSYKV